MMAFPFVEIVEIPLLLLRLADLQKSTLHSCLAVASLAAWCEGVRCEVRSVRVNNEE